MRLAVSRVIKNWKVSSDFVPSEKFFKLNGVSPGRRYISHTETPFAEVAFKSYNICMDAPEPLYGHMICNNFNDGAFVHQHIDTAPLGFAHVRCNWMIKKPPIGGDAILDDEIVLLEEGDLWLCIASIERHGTTPISGGERLIYSFGALVGLEQIRPLISESSLCHTLF